MQAKQDILLVWDRVGDYHRARWQAMQGNVSAANVHLADRGAADNLYKWENTEAGSHYHLLSQKPVNEKDVATRVKNFTHLLDKHPIGLVGIAGYGRTEYLLFLLICKMKGRKVVLFAESWYGGKSMFNTLKGNYLKATVTGYLVSGQRAKEHFVNNLGIPAQQIEIGYSVVDNTHFAQGNKSAYGISKTLLCVARFADEKNLATLITAFLASDMQASGWQLKLVGGGPLGEGLKREAAGNPAIIFSNWLGYSELPKLYAEADFFILPSKFEPWGLVVNEAMSAGLPLALSHETGCEPEFAKAENAFTFQAESEGELTATLNKIATLTPESLKAMGQAGKEIISHFTPETWATSFLRLGKYRGLQQ